MVDLKNKKVRHASLGDGVVIEQDDKYITVEFASRTSKFMYPGAFEKFLKTAVEDDQTAILQEIDTLKEQERAEKEALAKRAAAKTLADFNAGVGSPVSIKPVRQRKEKVYARKNVAFKCNFNDGGKTADSIGYCSVCSDPVIENNIAVEKRNWCTQPECACMQYYNGEITRRELDSYCEDGGFVCYESQMLREWTAYAGAYTSGEKIGEPMKLRNVQKNSLAVLTTRKPVSEEKDRFIFALFLVDDFDEGDGDNEQGAYVSTKSIYKLVFSEKECRKLLFWNYHANDNDPAHPAWASGLFRYIDDNKAVQILRDAVRVKKGTKDEDLAKEFLEYFCQINGVDEGTVGSPEGALMRR